MIEVVGLLMVVWAGRHAAGDLVGRSGELLGPPTDPGGWAGVLGGAFFAFLGSEDIDSVAEETDNASVTLPRAIVLTLAITAVLFMTVSAVAVLTVEPGVLARSDAPLALIHERPGGNADVLSRISALAMVNGALVQLVMVSRVVYGLANLHLVPAWAGAVSSRTHPVRATVAAAIVIVVLEVTLDLGPLARLTSAATLAVFVAINAALIAIHRRDGPTTTFQVPRWTPFVAITASVVMFAAEVARLANWV